MVKLRHWQIEELYGSYHQKEKKTESMFLELTKIVKVQFTCLASSYHALS